MTLTVETDSVRIDQFIADTSELSRTAAAILCDKGCVTVNGNVAGKSRKLKVGDVVDFTLPIPVDCDIKAENIPINVVYEDDDLLVVNKSKGMVVHPAAGHYSGTLVNALMFYCKGSLSGINGELRPGIVHRIDKDTSGLLLVAKNDFAHVLLAEQIAEHSLDRVYEAVVQGEVRCAGSVRTLIGRDPKDRKKMSVVKNGGKIATTHYTPLKHFATATHLKLQLETGRTHQIRVHMKHIAHPVIGDSVYGSGKPQWLEGQCLHARSLSFVHPRSKERVVLTSELPPYFVKLLSEL